MMNELSAFFDEAYREPYSFLRNDSVKESLKIEAKMETLGKMTALIHWISIVPMKRWHNPLDIGPHVCTEKEDNKIDVFLGSEHEEIYCKNSQGRDYYAGKYFRAKEKPWSED